MEVKVEAFPSAATLSLPSVFQVINVSPVSEVLEGSLEKVLLYPLVNSLTKRNPLLLPSL
ncbi:hypothetical protein FOE74_07720 [Rufibacter glacialis]|uniref:Uncharacterized protein n=1 Tax=Rufibacter glacialis TaxID=1259555 RepID=A0A5M8QKY9_9BACT|nr:hypothetical protein FOE74_07720 [Rufibacter glacialis]